MVGISLALPPIIIVAAYQSDELRTWTSSVLESTADVQHRKAVLEARAGRFEESFAYFDQALAGDVGEVAWVDYLKALSWAQRHGEVLDAFERMPETLRFQPEVLAAVANARFERGEYDAVAALISRLLTESDAAEAQRFGDALAAADVRRALHSVREALRERPDDLRWAEQASMEVLHRRAVAQARAGKQQAALEVLGELSEVWPNPSVLADRLVVLCWAGRTRDAVELFLSLRPGDEVPEYALAELARAWRDDEKTPELPEEILTRLLERTRARPDLFSELIAGCRSEVQLGHARAVVSNLSSGAAEPEAVAAGLYRDIDRRLAFLRARRGDHAPALSQLAALLAANPDDAGLRADLVAVQSWAGRHQDALQTARPLGRKERLPAYALEAIERSRAAVQRLQREDREAQHRRAVELARAGELEAATQLIEEASRGSADPNVHIDRAVILAWAERDEDAVAAFEALPPGSPRPDYLLLAVAGAYRNLEDYESALALYREVLASEPEHRAALEASIEMLLEEERISNPRGVIKELDLKGLPAAKLRARITHQEAVLLGRAGEHERALAMLDAAAKTLPGDETIACDRVAVLTWAGLHWEAVEAFEALSNRGKVPAWVRREAAEAYRAIHRPGTALALYAGLLAEDPADADSLDRLQTLLDEKRARMLAPGLSTLARRGAAAPAWLKQRSWADARHGRAVELAQKGAPAPALDTLRGALASPAHETGVLADYLVLLYLSGRYPETVALSRALSPAARKPVEALVVSALGASGKPGDALALARRWLARSPSDPRAATAVVHRLLAVGKVKEARAALASVSTTASPRLSADLLLYGGEAARAAVLYRERLRAYPDDREAALGLAVALALQGDPEAPLHTAAALERLSIEDYLLHQTLSAPSALALGRLLNGMRRPAEAGAVLNALLADHPKHLEALFEVALSFELRRERLEAAKIYDRVLRLAPRNGRAAQARTKVLIQLGAVSTVDARPDPMLLQTRVVQRWAWKQAGRTPEELAQETVDALDSVETGEVNLYDAALRAAAEAHSELGDEQRALELYRALAARLQEKGGEAGSELFSTRMEEVRSLLKLMRVDEAGALIERLDAETTKRIALGKDDEAGWDQAELALERGWWLVAQDRLAEAEAHFARLHRRSPRWAEAGSALAQTYLMRGWPRQAQRELEETAALHPDDVDVQMELARVRYANGDYEGAERIVADATAWSPDDPSVRALIRERELARRPEVSAEAVADTTAAVADGLEAAIGFEAPVHPRAKLSATLGWRREGSGYGAADRRRAGVGAELQLHRDLNLEAWASADPTDLRFRIAGRVAWAPSDHFTFAIQGDSDTWALPYGALRAGVFGRELEASGTWRHSDLFEVETRLRALGLDDGNRVFGAAVDAELLLATTGRWRAALLLEAGAEDSSAREAPYFSPAQSGSAALIPAVEHLWLRTRRYELVDRLSLAAGASYESGFGFDELGELAYQQQHRFAQWGDLVLETAFSRRHYEGVPELGWRLGLGSHFRF